MTSEELVMAHVAKDYARLVEAYERAIVETGDGERRDVLSSNLAALQSSFAAAKDVAFQCTVVWQYTSALSRPRYERGEVHA